MTRDKSDRPTEDGGDKIEIRLDESSELELQHVSVNTQDDSLSFEMRGMIHDVESELLATLAGKQVTPVAVSLQATETEA